MFEVIHRRRHVKTRKNTGHDIREGEVMAGEQVFHQARQSEALAPKIVKIKGIKGRAIITTDYGPQRNLPGCRDRQIKVKELVGKGTIK